MTVAVPKTQNRKIASTANINWALLVPLSQGLALYAYSWRTSGRVEINSLNRCVTPIVRLWHLEVYFASNLKRIENPAQPSPIDAFHRRIEK